MPGVASSSSYCNDYFLSNHYKEVVEDAFLHNSPSSFASKSPSDWAELINWSVCRDTLGCLGFNDGAETAWMKVGIPVESTVCMNQSNLLKRRRLLGLILSASQAHSWPAEDVAHGEAFGLVISTALTECQSTLDEVKRKQAKTKSGTIGTQPYQEPSALIVEFVMKNPGQTMCLHLSNLQKMPLEEWRGIPQPSGFPVAMNVMEVRGFYAAVTQNRNKAIEAIKGLHDCHLTLWAPDKQEHMAHIIHALQEAAKAGASPELTFLVPYNPLPGCVKPEHITDVWGHYLLGHKFQNLIKNVVFINEASRNVFTSDTSPVYQNKNIAAITCSGNCLQDYKPSIVSMRSTILSDAPPGEVVVIDCPQQVCNNIFNRLCKATINIEHPAAEGIKWTINRRSPASSKKEGYRSTIHGQTQTFVQCHYSAIIQWIKSFVLEIQGTDFAGNIGPIGRECIVGRIGLFTEQHAVIANCDASKFHLLFAQCVEAVVVSPNKMIIIPTGTGDQLSTLLTENEALANVTIKFRQSSTHKGKEFAKPNKLPDHLRATRLQNLVHRMPQHKAELLRSQVQIEVFGINGQHNDNTAEKIIEAINNNATVVGADSDILEIAKDLDEHPQVGEWAPVLRDGGIWTGRILLQPFTYGDMEAIHQMLDHSQICIKGLSYTISVTTPFDPYLATRLLEGRVRAMHEAQGVVCASDMSY